MPECDLDTLFEESRARIPAPQHLAMPPLSFAPTFKNKRLFWGTVAVALSLLLAIGTPLLVRRFTQKPSRIIYSPTASEEPALAIMEAVDYPQSVSLEKGEDGKVRFALANLYYGTADDGSYALLIGTLEHPGYDFTSISLAFQKEGAGVSAQQDVSLSDYAKAENGIALEKRRNASWADYHLVYAFDLVSLLGDTYQGKITFTLTYVEALTSGLHTFGRHYSFACEKSLENLSLASFACASFNVVS